MVASNSPVGSPPAPADSLSSLASLPAGFGGFTVQMDMSGLEQLLKQLTTAMDAKMESVTGQLTELQSIMDQQQKYVEITRHEMEDVLSRLDECVSRRELDDIKAMEPKLKGAFSKQMEQLRAETTHDIAKLEEKKANRDLVDRLVSRESIERVGYMEAAINQQRMTTIESRVEELRSSVQMTTKTLRQVKSSLSAPVGRTELGKALNSPAVLLSVTVLTWGSNPKLVPASRFGRPRSRDLRLTRAALDRVGAAGLVAAVRARDGGGAARGAGRE